MPVISCFFGIYVRMYFDDHLPPHVHVEYQGAEALVAIETGELLEGRLPRKAAKLIKDWCADHQPELSDNWQRAVALQPLRRIPGADND
ncbi:DUF4160 domain-containing protein [Thiocystis violascens]|uniref:DUF4160 domain-containing protein n=1 Tax=Thiocystis violascens (strain ATCC 17096 / DSM 198 / 6111) TaxID=765911 RepID=I3Y9C6_THIV6|nr:DUF4160 domain-containing protein [Thiocystis violascens]AFL73594.1 hypothetical protein Thivi_1608 [Thiocystis violascens DSM 198]